MSYFVPIFLLAIVAIEVYYWAWWLPRNWEKTREAGDFGALKSLYGKDGTVRKMMEEGKL